MLERHSIIDQLDQSLNQQLGEIEQRLSAGNQTAGSNRIEQLDQSINQPGNDSTLSAATIDPRNQR